MNKNREVAAKTNVKKLVQGNLLLHCINEDGLNSTSDQIRIYQEISNKNKKVCKV